MSLTTPIGRAWLALTALVYMLHGTGHAATSLTHQEPRIGLVLSGGGGRGFAHVGVLRALEEENIPIYCIVGTSMGAVVGGLYASGYSPDEIDSLLGRYSWEDLFKDNPDRRLMYTGRKDVSDRHLVEIRLRGLKPQWARSLSTGQRVSQALAEMVWRAPIQSFGNFDRLRVRFRAIATSLESGRCVELGGGDLAEAMRASMSVPILFQPVQIDGGLLIDGGISSNIPVESARKLGSDLIVAVDVTSPLRDRSQLREAWEMADQVVAIMQAEVNQRARQSADLLIRPDLHPDPMNVFARREEQVAAGARAMLAETDRLRRMANLLAEKSPGPDPDEPPPCGLRVELLDGERWRVLSPPDRTQLAPWPQLDSLLFAQPWTWLNSGILRQNLLETGTYREVQCDTIRQSGATTSLACPVLRVRLWPNPRVRVVQVDGLAPIQRHMPGARWSELAVDSLMASVPTDGLLQQSQVDQVVQEMIGRIRRAGYTLCDLDSVSVVSDTLHVHMDAGLLQGLRVEGLDHLRPGVLLKEFRPRSGEVFNVAQADRSIGRLYASGLYEQVSLRLDRDGSRNLAILHATESEFPVLRAGLRYGSAREGEGFLQLLWENLLGRSLRGELSWLAGAWRQEQHVALESDRIWRTWLTTRLSGRSAEQVFWQEGRSSPDPAGARVAIRRESEILQLQVGQQIAGLGTVYASGALEWDEETAAGLHRHRQLGRIGLLSLVDSRDRRSLPRRGEHHHVSFEQLVPRWSGEAPAFRALAEFDSWRSMGPCTGQLSLFLGQTDSQERRDQFEFGGDDWIRSLETAQLAGRQALCVRARWQQTLAGSDLGEWLASLRWSLLGLNDDLDGWPRRGDLVQELSLALHLDSRLGELSAGLARLTESGLAGRQGLKLWVDLGYAF